MAFSSRSLPTATSKERYPVELKIVEYRRGDALVLISDGLPELVGEHGAQLGYEAVQRRLAEIAEGSAAEILDGLVSLGQDWSGDGPQDDDVTVVVIKRV